MVGEGNVGELSRNGLQRATNYQDSATPGAGALLRGAASVPAMRRQSPNAADLRGQRSLHGDFQVGIGSCSPGFADASRVMTAPAHRPGACYPAFQTGTVRFVMTSGRESNGWPSSDHHRQLCRWDAPSSEHPPNAPTHLAGLCRTVLPAHFHRPNTWLRHPCRRDQFACLRRNGKQSSLPS